MLTTKGQINIIIIIFILLIILTGFLSISKVSAGLIFFVLLSLVIFLIAFIKIDFALAILIFSMLLSPELPLGAITGREVVIRMDDIFLLVVFLGWLAKMAINKELGFLKTTPLNRPILIYIFICIIATLFGALRGYAKLHISIFYILKYLEYYLLFFMVTNNLKNIRQIKTFVFFIIFVAFIVSIYACIQHFHGVARVTAPFEGEAGEANTLGGYLILITMIVTGLILNLPSLKEKALLSVVLTFAFPAFIFTLSRGSWFGFIPALIALIILTRKGRTALSVAFLLVVLFAPLIFPRYFYERINYTFSQGREYRFIGKRVTLEESAAARVNVMKYALRVWTKEPLLGYGVGSSISVIDSQYARVLIELGLIGFISFMWIVLSIFINAMRYLIKLKDNNFSSGLISGFIAGFVGLLVHALAAETFIIIRIMEPFWFLTAIVMMLPQNILSESSDI